MEGYQDTLESLKTLELLKTLETLEESLPFQENLLLANQYRPGVARPVYRLLGEGGLVPVSRLSPSPIPSSRGGAEPPSTEAALLPSRVLLGRVKVQPSPSSGAMPKSTSPSSGMKPRSPSPRSPTVLSSVGINLWGQASRPAGPSPAVGRAGGEDRGGSGGFRGGGRGEGADSTQILINHNMQPRVYFLPS